MVDVFMIRTSHPDCDAVVDEINRLMSDFSHTKKDLGYGIRWTFENKMRFDLIDYRKQGSLILRIGRGAWLVKQYPILEGLFDHVMKVVAKIEIHSVDTLREKHVAGLLELLDQAPISVGVRD